MVGLQNDAVAAILEPLGDACYNARMNIPFKPPTKLKIVAIGNSAGVLLPKEMLARLRLDKGDQLSVVETSDGFELRAYDPEFEEQMGVMRDVMKRRRNALRELAK